MRKLKYDLLRNLPKGHTIRGKWGWSQIKVRLDSSKRLIVGTGNVRNQQESEVSGAFWGRHHSFSGSRTWNIPFSTFQLQWWLRPQSQVWSSPVTHYLAHVLTSPWPDWLPPDFLELLYTAALKEVRMGVPTPPAKEESLLRDTTCPCGQLVMPHCWASPCPTTCLEGGAALAPTSKSLCRGTQGRSPITPISRPVTPGQNGCSVQGKMSYFRLVLLLLLQRQTMVPKKAAVPAPVLCPCIRGARNNGPLKASTPGPCAQAGGPSAPWPTNTLQVQKEERGNLYKRGGGISHSSITCLAQYAPAHVYTHKDTLTPPTPCFITPTQDAFANPVYSWIRVPGSWGWWGLCRFCP